MKCIDESRKRIDEIDKKIVKLLCDRLKLASNIGKVKKKNNENIYVPSREIEVLKKIIGYNRERFPENILKRIYYDIITASYESEGGLRIICQSGDNSIMLVSKRFGSNNRCIIRNKIKDVLSGVVRNRADFAVIPEFEIGTGTPLVKTIEKYDIVIIAELYDDMISEVEPSLKYSRFFVVGKRLNEKSGYDKTYISLKITGEKYKTKKIKEIFNKRKVAIKKIDFAKINNSKKNIFIEFDGYYKDRRITQILKELEKYGVSVKILGSYPEGVYV